MNGSTDEQGSDPVSDRWVPAVTGTMESIRVDLRYLHRSWMGLAFPRQTAGDHAVVVSWKPETVRQRVAYGAWGALGLLAVSLVYLLTVLGYALRFYSRRIDRTAASLGFLGVVAISLVAWGTLSAATLFSAIPFGGFLAVVTAGIVATISAVLALYFSRNGDRATTIALGYPFGVTALFLPPVVAALHSEWLAEIIFPGSTTLAIWILDNLLDFAGINAFIRATFDLQGIAYVGMWFALAFPVGWALGLLVTLPTWIRESRPQDPADVAASWSGDSRQ